MLPVCKNYFFKRRKTTKMSAIRKKAAIPNNGMNPIITILDFSLLMKGF